MCLGCEELEAWASWLDCRTGDDGVLKTCFLEPDAGGPSISSILRTGACMVGLAGPIEKSINLSASEHGICCCDGFGHWALKGTVLTYVQHASDW